MCKKRELTEEPLINRVRQPINERSIQTLLQKQLAIMALIDTMTITMDPEKGIGLTSKKDGKKLEEIYHLNRLN